MHLELHNIRPYLFNRDGVTKNESIFDKWMKYVSTVIPEQNDQCKIETDKILSATYKMNQSIAAIGYST